MSNPNDVVYTPEWIALDMIKHFKPEGIILDPCSGGGVFFNNLEGNKYFCEIEKGVDFFDFELPVRWIISNPPYSIFDEWLTHSLSLADEVCYLIPVNKLLSSYKKLQEVYKWGGIKHIRYYGSGRKIGFPFGFPVGAVHLSKNYKGEVGISFA
ncbi:hypothetical protein PQZ66_gp33 [Klebsiella phage vB_KleM_KB2]|nr:hypothetical protein PQZ66_gp33 [Klebsiella phage vB_KleM_KB2]